MTARKPTSPSLADLLGDKPASEATKTPKTEVVENPDGATFSRNRVVIDKTPAEMAAETSDEVAARFGISSEAPDDVLDDPNVQVYREDKNFQVQGGTHVHPDIAKDNYNRAVGSPSGGVRTTRTIEEDVWAGEAENDDKGLVGTSAREEGSNEEFDRDEDYVDDEKIEE